MKMTTSCSLPREEYVIQNMIQIIYDFPFSLTKRHIQLPNPCAHKSIESTDKVIFHIVSFQENKTAALVSLVFDMRIIRIKF